mgnify:CR=1 FL=1
MPRTPQRPSWRRHLVLALLGLSVLLGAAAPASAATTLSTTTVTITTENEAPKRACEQGSIDIKGTNNLCADRYRTLTLDRGDAWTASKMADAWVYDMAWGAYYSSFMGNVELINWLYSFEWINWISDIVAPIATNFANIINKFGITSMAMSLSALVYGITWLRGNRSKALAGIVLVCLVAAMTTVFANPSKYFFEENGLFPQAKSLGNELVTAAVAGPGDTSGMYQPDSSKPANEVLLKTTVGPKMVDSLVDDPYEVISFGKKLEGECRSVFVEAMGHPEALKTGNNFVRDKVSACDPQAKAFSESPSTRLGSVLGVVVMGLGYQLMLYTLLGVLFFCVILAAIKLILAIWQCLKALFPGTDTTEVFSSLVTAGMYLVFVGISGLFLAIVLVIATNFMGLFSAMPAMKYQVVGALFFIGLIVMVIMWRKVAKGARRMGNSLRNALNRASKPENGTPQLVTRSTHILKRLGSRSLASALGNRLGNSGRDDERSPVATGTSPQTRPTDSAQPPASDPATTPKSGPGATDPAPDSDAPASPKSAKFKSALMAVATRTPAGTAVVKAGQGAIKAGTATAHAAQAGKQKAAVVAQAAREQWKQQADPETRRSARNEALRAKLEGLDQTQSAKETAREHAAQVREAKHEQRQKARALKNEVSTERANAPRFDADHEAKQREAAAKIATLSGREKRVETLRARLNEGQWQERRLREARERAQATIEARSQAAAGTAESAAPEAEPVKRP